MTTRTITTLVDDIDGTEAVETVEFALDGVAYEIDLNLVNATTLRAAVATWAHSARSTGKPKLSRRTVKAAGDSRNALIRAWAAQQGLTVPARGRIPNDVQRQYDSAH